MLEEGFADLSQERTSMFYKRELAQLEQSSLECHRSGCSPGTKVSVLCAELPWAWGGTRAGARDGGCWGCGEVKDHGANRKL